jgi:tetratricopeptide (TPR) repeat protein
MRPNFASAFNNRGLIFMRMGDLQRAFADFNQAVNLIPASSPIRYIHLCNRARVEGLQKNNDAALADCDAVLGKSPKAVYTLTSRANAYLGKGDLDAALNDYNEPLKISPNNIRAHAGRGLLFEKRKDLVAARSDYRSASATLTKYDDADTAIARRIARERLTALMATLPPPAAATPAKPAPGQTATPAAPAGPRKVALIVGNGSYRNVQPLDNPPRDAKLIASTFRDLGFATVTLAPDLTRDKFFAALHEFGAEAEKSDWAVVYYAGHGMEIGGINYLIPTDARLAADHDAEAQAVALEQVSGARKLRLVMLDACRDNPFEKTMQHTIALKLVSKGFSNIEPEAGFMVVYAKHGETALDGDSAQLPARHRVGARHQGAEGRGAKAVRHRA